MSSLEYLVNSRKYSRARVTRICNSEDTFDELSRLERHNLVAKLNKLAETLRELDDKISVIKYSKDLNEEELDADLEISETYQDKITNALGVLEKSRQVTEGMPHGSEVARSFLKCPTAPLPRFCSGEVENLDLFFNNFEETLSKFKYTEYDKFLLLKQQIDGKATYLIDSLEADKCTYSEAKKLLLSAFATTDISKFNTIKQLTEIKLPYGDEPFKYVSQMRKVQQSVCSLKINVEDVMQYFFLSGLNETFRTQLVQITNNVRPSLAQINENFFAANERYMVALKSSSDKKSKSFHREAQDAGILATNSFAVSAEPKIQNPFHNCTLCSKINNSHSINKCTAYPTAADKVSRLGEIGACVKCGNLDHKFTSCKFKFKKSCLNCSGWHFTFLCGKAIKVKPKDASLTNGAPKKSEPVAQHSTTNSVSVCVAPSACWSAAGLESILPTFSCAIGNDLHIRGLRDSGSQSNLISEKALRLLNYQILQNDVELKVNGINHSKQYQSKLVRIDLTFGNMVRSLEAMTIPEINISLKLPSLSVVVDGFLSQGYELADRFLLNGKDSIEDIDLILGANAAYCFEDRNVSFGVEKLSVFSLTPFGVLLLGDVGQLLTDLDYIPPYSEFCAKDNDVQPNFGFQTMSCALASSATSTNQPNDNCRIIHEDRGKVIGGAVEGDLEQHCSFHLGKVCDVEDDENSELNNSLVEFLIKNTKRKNDGRLVMPLLWNGRASHNLAKNFKLAKQILNSNLKKLSGSNHLQLMDNAVKELEGVGSIEKINNLEEYMESNPTCSFLAHMPIIKLNKETTKCRIVFLSNLCERSKEKPHSVSHNQAMHPGPCLNQKLMVSLLLLRFDKKLLCFDLKKAFLQIELMESDQSKLLFLWYRNVAKKDFAIQAYKNVRLPFGLRCSPTVLMVALYQILILNANEDPEDLRSLKRQIYSLIYMDNGAISAQTSEQLSWAHDQLNEIFNPYQFHLQQFVTNDTKLQKVISDTESKSVDLLGMVWDRETDTLSTKPKVLSEEANTKRKILKSIAENFDPYNYDAPLLNRARLFMHELQIQQHLGWDSILSKEQCREWVNIAKQVNGAPTINVPRFIGARGGSYKLVAFCDSSKAIYGTAVYIIDNDTNAVSFLLAKNRIVTKQLEGKSIPSLELLSVVLGAETVADLKNDLCGPCNLDPIRITDLEVYSDSLVALNWIHNYCINLGKMNKQNVFVMNRLEKLKKLADRDSFKFAFIDGINNPADCVTRAMSYKTLVKTNYITGPKFLGGRGAALSRPDVMQFTVPDRDVCTTSLVAGVCESDLPLSLVSPDKYSSFSKCVRIVENLLIFVNNLKKKLNLKIKTNSELNKTAMELVIKFDQKANFSEIFHYYEKTNPIKRDMPNLVKQLNVFVDNVGVLRVGSKFVKCKNGFKSETFCPVLLARQSKLTNLIIREAHERLNHAGVYSVLQEIRNKYWIPKYFSFVKKVLRSCVHCKRFKQRTIKLNQSPYRSFRFNPTNIPFADIFIDYLGPFYVRDVLGGKVKVWILCLTCLWTRAINLKVTETLSTDCFLRSFQLHSFEYGVPQRVFSDLGTQLVAGANVIADFFNDFEVQKYFRENNSSVTEFQQYFKGHSQLGSLVEVCVKLTKRMLYGAIGKNVLPIRDFYFLVAQAVHMLNRRPVAFQECLRSDIGEDVPEAITPEMLIHGRPLVSVNVIPSLQSDSDEPDWLTSDNAVGKVVDTYDKLRKVRQKLIEVYNSEFLATLIKQATNERSRYQPVTHNKLSVGDIVILKEDNCKMINYPMAIVKKLQVNELGEVTGAVLLKGGSREEVKRHSSTIIPILQVESNAEFVIGEPEKIDPRQPIGSAERKQTRKAALQSRETTQRMLNM